MSPVQFRCPSCTRTDSAEPLDGEHLFATKARIRAMFAETCPRSSATAQHCPMRDKAPAIPTLADFEIA